MAIPGFIFACIPGINANFAAIPGFYFLRLFPESTQILRLFLDFIAIIPGIYSNFAAIPGFIFTIIPGINLNFAAIHRFYFNIYSRREKFSSKNKTHILEQ